jgi:hypothetical protein
MVMVRFPLQGLGRSAAVGTAAKRRAILHNTMSMPWLSIKNHIKQHDVGLVWILLIDIRSLLA